MSDRIAVVSGLPRSGTSLVMQMLAAGGIAPLCDGVRAPDADNPRGYFEHERVRSLARDTSVVAQARGRALKVVVPLLDHLPPGEDYRVLLVERSLDEVVTSQDRMLARRAEPGAVDPPEIARERLLQLLARQLQQARARLAQRGIPFLAVRHAQLIGDASACAREIARFLDAALDVDAMARAVDPSLHRAFAGPSDPID
jgi:hypothetical protein